MRAHRMWACLGVALACMVFVASTADAQMVATGVTPSLNDQGSARPDAAPDASILWTDLGFALAGYAGDPVLAGVGLLEAGAPTVLSLSNARPVAPAVLLVSLTANATPFKGGVLLPVPAQIELLALTTRQGAIDLAFTWPIGVPPGTDIYMQYVIGDAAAPAMYAISNALKAHPLRF